MWENQADIKVNVFKIELQIEQCIVITITNSHFNKEKHFIDKAGMKKNRQEYKNDSYTITQLRNV